jgi:hypothetical protein
MYQSCNYKHESQFQVTFTNEVHLPEVLTSDDTSISTVPTITKQCLD